MRAIFLVVGLSLTAFISKAATPAPIPMPAAAVAVVKTNEPAPAFPRMVSERLSVFEPSAPGVRDPFFPRSAPVAFSVAHPTPAAGQPPRNIFSQLRLRGLVANRLAVINGRTFGPEEELTVTLDDGGTAKIRVHEIAEKGVTITVSGEAEKRVLRNLGSQK